MRKAMALLTLSLALTAAFYLLNKQAKHAAPATDTDWFAVKNTGLPSLEDEKSPYFSRVLLKRADGHRREEILNFRKDGSVAHLYFGENDVLKHVEVYKRVGEQHVLAYESDYDAAGRRVQKARYYGADNKLETAVERQADGSEKYSFFKGAELIQTVELAVDGSQKTVNYEAGQVKSSETTAPPASNLDLFHWDEAKTQLRLRVHLLGARLSSWEYFERGGTMTQSGKVLADGSLEFAYLDKGKVKRRQVWRFVGEDWERSYYGLAYSELMSDDGKVVEHKVWLHSNGFLKRHERFNSKTGALEMGRDFDLEGRTSRMEEFTETGASKQIWEYPASGPRTRGFVPDGMRDYPGSDEKLGSVYDLDGAPFQRSILERQAWSFFRVRADKKDVSRGAPPQPFVLPMHFPCFP